MPLVYSYTRFSDPRQSDGHSAERQAAYAQRWAAERGYTLDTSLSMRDEGLSAYHQRHIKQGAFGLFLRAVEDGRIPAGSVLIVEGLDRLSRAEPIQAQATLTSIINAGITVVTASDGKEYNRERLRANPMDLVYSLLVAIRAHEESDTKSKRVTAAIRRQCEAWQAGTYRGPVRAGKDPDWLRWDGKAWQVVEERRDAILQAVAMYETGYGAVRIVRELTERGLSITKTGNSAQHLYKLLRNPCLYGTKTLTIGGEEMALAGYYPPLMEEHRFNRLQGVADTRKGQRNRGEIPSVLTGIGVLRCGYCGTALFGQNLMRRNRLADGRPQPGHRRVLCVAYQFDTGCPVGGSCSVVPLETAVMAFCADQMNLSGLMAEPEQASTTAQLASHRAKADKLRKQVERVTAAMLESDEAPASFARKARELEAQLEQEQATIKTLEASIALPATTDNAAAWQALRHGVEQLDYPSRIKARTLVADTFKRIVVYHKGTDGKARHIDMVLVAKRGGTRLLRIHRQTGELLAGEHVAA